MVMKEPFQTLLGKCESTTDIYLQTILKFLSRLFQKWLLARMLDAVDCERQLQVLEALVCLDIREGLFERCFGCVAGKGFEYGVGVGFADLRNYRFEGLRTTS
jgi:hypothetical protein